MAQLLRMPGVSADADEATLEGWAVAAGAAVASGDPIASVETEKAVVDIDAAEDAIVHTLLVAPGTVVPVGDPIAVLLAPGEPADAADELVHRLQAASGTAAAPDSAASAPAAAAAQAGPVRAAPPDPVRPAFTPSPARPDLTASMPPAASAAPAAPAPGGAPAPARLFASPIARRLARELHVDLAALAGSGPGGRILRDDVTAAARQAGPAPIEAAANGAAPGGTALTAAHTPAATPLAAEAPAAAETRTVVAGGRDATAVPHSKLRRLIATRLQESKQTIPHFYLTRHLNATALLRLRARLNEQPGMHISVNDLIVKAAAVALIRVPELNVSWTDDALLHFGTADIAVAVASKKGLVTPTLRSIEHLTLSELSAAIRDAVRRADEGRLKQAELEGGSLSITNLGMFGIDQFEAIINPPQCAILAVGAAGRRPVVAEDGGLAAADMLTVTLSVDHRAVDGAAAAQWLACLAGLIESPLQILV